MALASLIVAVIALIGSGVSIRYTRNQAVAAGQQTAIERSRYHTDLTPELQLTAHDRDTDGNLVELTVELTGPSGLDRLDDVTLRIRDDMPDRTPGQGSTLTKEQISNTIWGPYRIKSGLIHTDSYGRQHGPFKLPKNEPYPIPLERSYEPTWVTDPRYWRDQYQGSPVRLEFTCRREGQDPWTVPLEIVPQPHITRTIA